MKTFEVGKMYRWADGAWDSVRVVARTEKTVTVRCEMCDNHAKWRMLIRHDDEGNEIAIDSSVPKKYRSGRTCNAKWEV